MGATPDRRSDAEKIADHSAIKVGNYYTLADYWLANSGAGALAAEWTDKPHRLVFDLVFEVERLTGLVDELAEKIGFLRAGCLNASRDDLIQRITAVGSAEWRSGDWIARRTAPIEAKLDEANRRIETAVALCHEWEDGVSPEASGMGEAVRAVLDAERGQE